MITSKSVANAVGGKTARACDSCVKKRAKWYCAADDAFLCQSCDSNIHSANPLARRHDRVQLKIGSLKALQVEPSWHRGFKRKARTPRPGKPNPLSKSLSTLIPFVPELGSDEVSVEDNEEEQQLLYRVPNFDPFAADEFCASNGPRFVGNTVESLQGFSPSEMDLAEFAADVESLLGRGLENESFRMEELGFVGCKEEMEIELNCLESGKDEEGKEQQQQKHEFDCEIDMAKDAPFELSFEYDSATCGEEEEKVDGEAKNNNGESEKKSKEKNQKKKKIELNLDYEAVISAWAAQACPWTDGKRPEIDLEEECWPDWITGNWGGEVGEQGYGGVGGQYQAMARGGREARVCRYREKRRTRLFSKKIRYEVRKLNAEKRPRMKGRFVKRATFAAAALHSK